VPVLGVVVPPEVPPVVAPVLGVGMVELPGSLDLEHPRHRIKITKAFFIINATLINGPTWEIIYEYRILLECFHTRKFQKPQHN